MKDVKLTSFRLIHPYKITLAKIIFFTPVFTVLELNAADKPWQVPHLRVQTTSLKWRRYEHPSCEALWKFTAKQWGAYRVPSGVPKNTILGIPKEVIKLHTELACSSCMVLLFSKPCCIFLMLFPPNLNLTMLVSEFKYFHKNAISNWVF